jgi:hypothetical protein
MSRVGLVRTDAGGVVRRNLPRLLPLRRGQTVPR